MTSGLARDPVDRRNGKKVYLQTGSLFSSNRCRQPVMRASLNVQRVTVGRIPSVLIVSRNEGTRNGRNVVSLDSTFVARSDLRLLRHAIVERPYGRYDDIRVDQIFHGDSVTGSMRARGAKMPASRLVQPVDTLPHIG
jgi:hypothetical protein